MQSPHVADAPSRLARSTHLDALKGFAILCVVFGHAIQRNLVGGATHPVFLALGAFEMPLFMFLSGTVLSGRVHSPRGRWVGTRVTRLLVPYLAWTLLIFWMVRLPTQGYTPYIDFSGGFVGYMQHTLGVPAAGLWYLPALFWCSLVLAVLYPLRKRPLLIMLGGWIALAVMLYARARVGIAGDYGIARASEYWWFFSAGFAWRELGHGLEFKRPSRWVWLLAYPLAAPFAFMAVKTLPWFAVIPSRFALGVTGIAFSVVLLQMAAPLVRAVRLDGLGRMTLGVYCIHMAFLRPGIASGWLGVFAGWAVALSVSLAATWVIARIPWVRGVLLGDWPRQKRAASASS